MTKPKRVPSVTDQLRQAIRQSGQSLNQLSKLSAVGNDRLSRFMRGERDLTLTAAGRVCEALGLHLAGPGLQDEPPAPKKPRRPKK